MKKRILSLILCIAMCMSTVALFSACGKDEVDSLVIMTEELDGLFNPFFSTTAADGTIVSMTQIGMLSSKVNANGDVEVAYGDNEAVVVKDFESKHDKAANETVYTFVLKNGIKYSDGKPLTMEDVLFNLYVYLDPVYSGSNTMYSTKIKGLTAYRTQTKGAESDSNSDEVLTSSATKSAENRRNELVNIFNNTAKANQAKGDEFQASYNDMVNAINQANVSTGYKNAILNDHSKKTEAQWREQLLSDYKTFVEKYKEELNSTFDVALESFTEEPYKSRDEFKNQVTCFMYLNGYVEIEYEKVLDENGNETGKDDKSKIKNVTLQYNPENCKDKASAVEFALNDTISKQLNVALIVTTSAQTILNEYIAKAKEVLLHANIKDGELAVKDISGIVSLGHVADKKGTTVTVNGNEYKVATGHNDDGTVKNSDEYDVLQITIEGVDPKAKWNFAFSVAPQHYYGEGSSVGVDIENSKFGVEYGSFDFMRDIIQSPRNIKVPVGAGAYKATNRSDAENPAGNEFYSNNVVYFKANNYFETVGSGISNAKIEKVRYQVVSASNALAALESGSVHYVTPQLTEDNFSKIEALKKDGVDYILEDQLGYGYIGINAGKVTDINLRKAIMCAMNTSLALDYYRPGTASQIYWPMSMVSWAYPKENGQFVQDNGLDYPQIGKFNLDIAKANIEKYMEEAGVSAGDSALEITFTIAGSNLQDHPTYKTFRDAAALLNDMGWDITVTPDTQALTKLSTGSLEVWAAAWGSTIDPDLYQVYHKNSTATSTLAWGYPSIKTSGTAEEKDLLDDISKKIDEAREYEDEKTRAGIYEEAMKLILELAIELPVYQRSVIYAYNSDVIDSSSLPSKEEMNPFSSPLDRIWEIEFAK